MLVGMWADNAGMQQGSAVEIRLLGLGANKNAV